MIFCTYFDSYYLDKGLALYRSLDRVSSDFTLFIFCFDDRSYDVLNRMNLSNAVILHHSCFETDRLLAIKEERSKAEYCWTCTPIVIEFVLENFEVESCTYLDADLYFYASPDVLQKEIYRAQANAVIVEHRFKNNNYGRKLEKRNGKYCVQFNYFSQTEEARRILNWWKEKCIEWCYDIPEPDRMGDQKYLNEFGDLFQGVYELQNLGAGVAPWNLEKYKMIEKNDYDIYMEDENGTRFKLIFYHFQNIRYMPGRKVNIKSQTKDKRLKYAIYIPYLKEIEAIRCMLAKEYGILFYEKGIIRSSNLLIGTLQKYFAAFKIQSFSDIIDLNRLTKCDMDKKK